MATITAIRQQVRLKGRYSVYVDGTYSFSLGADALLEAKVYAGQELSGEELKACQKLSTDDRAYGLALAYAVRRIRSRWEIMEYLGRKEYDASLTRVIMVKLEACGLVSDAAFAEAWVRNRRLLKPVSRRRLTQELRQKRVPDDIITRVMATDETEDPAALRQLIASRRKLTRYHDDQKLVQYLARQGFGYDDIKAALMAESES